MKDLVLYIAKNLAQKPENVELQEAVDGDNVRLTLRTAEEDKGKIIGKMGKVIKAIRSVASAVGQKSGKKVTVDLE